MRATVAKLTAAEVEQALQFVLDLPLSDERMLLMRALAHTAHAPAPKPTDEQIAMAVLTQQLEWMQDAGGNEAAYHVRYQGYGDGGTAIWQADLLALKKKFSVYQAKYGPAIVDWKQYDPALAEALGVAVQR